MTNPANVTVIVDKLLGYLRTTVDVFLRKDLVPRITQLAERFAPDNAWFVETMNTLFEIAGDLVQPEVAYNLMRLIAEGTGNNNKSTGGKGKKRKRGRRKRKKKKERAAGEERGGKEK